MSAPKRSHQTSLHQEAADALLPKLRSRLQANFEEPPITTSSSVVYKAYSQLFNRTIAVKIINKKAIPKEIAEKFLPRELDVTLKVRHPHLARCLGIVNTPSPYQMVIIQEYYDRGNLLDLVIKEKRIKELPQACRYFRQLIEALHYLHERNIVHRENIMLDVNGDLKLLDFGFARSIARRERSNSFCGTRPYSCPQLSRSQPYDAYAADFYSAGIVLYTMVVGHWPKLPEIDFPQDIPSTACRRLIVSLLEEDEFLRAGYHDCVYSEWMGNEPNWIFAGQHFVYESIGTRTTKII